MYKLKNWNCDNDKCIDPDSKVKLLPIGSGGNIIVCKACFEHEIVFRKKRNRELIKGNKFDLPLWENL